VLIVKELSPDSPSPGQRHFAANIYTAKINGNIRMLASRKMADGWRGSRRGDPDWNGLSSPAAGKL
jgi:hypothetical protein